MAMQRIKEAAEAAKCELSSNEDTEISLPFIAADEEGLQTTLGRNGSDFSAAIFAALADAGEQGNQRHLDRPADDDGRAVALVGDLHAGKVRAPLVVAERDQDVEDLVLPCAADAVEQTRRRCGR